MMKQGQAARISERLSLSGGKYCLVVAGADCVLSDVERARELLSSLGLLYSVCVINDMIVDFPRSYDFAATLHPDKLIMWLDKREATGLEKPSLVFSHRMANGLVTHATNDWGGSSSLFAVKCMLECGVQRIIVCGAPMNPTNHYLRGKPWMNAVGFRRGWERHKSELIGRVRSMSGWTNELLGGPDSGWLTQLPDAAPRA